MSAVAWPSVRSALVTGLKGALPSTVTVYDGPVVTGDRPSAYLTLAYRPSVDDPSAGDFTQGIGPDGYSAVEAGTVLAELAGVTGSTTVPDVFATFDTIAGYVQAHQTLDGTLTPDAVLTVSADVEQSQTTAGAVQRLLLTFTYTTRIP